MKKILPLLIVLALVSSILVFVQTRPKSTVTNTNQVAVQIVNVVIDTASGAPQTYQVQDLANPTAFSALQAATTANAIALDFVPPGQYGVFIKAIAGKVGDAKQFWIYKLNGVEGQIAADQQTLTNGDTVTWVYTTSSAN